MVGMADPQRNNAFDEKNRGISPKRISSPRRMSDVMSKKVKKSIKILSRSTGSKKDLTACADTTPGSNGEEGGESLFVPEKREELDSNSSLSSINTTATTPLKEPRASTDSAANVDTSIYSPPSMERTLQIGELNSTGKKKKHRKRKLIKSVVKGALKKGTRSRTSNSLKTNTNTSVVGRSPNLPTSKTLYAPSKIPDNFGFPEDDDDVISNYDYCDELDECDSDNDDLDARGALEAQLDFRHFLEFGYFRDDQVRKRKATAITRPKQLFGITIETDDEDDGEGGKFSKNEKSNIDNGGPRIRGKTELPRSLSRLSSTASTADPDKVARIARAALSLDSAGNDLFEKGEYTRAMASYRRSLRLKKRTLQLAMDLAENVPPTPHDEKNLGKKKHKNKIPGSSVVAFKGLDKEQRDAMLASVATSINNIGYIRQRSGKATAQETMAAYKDSLRIKQKILGNDSLSVAKTMNNIGSVYFAMSDFQSSLRVYGEAHAIMIRNLGKDNLDVATISSNMGDVHLATHQSDQALIKYREALRVRWMLLKENDPRVIRLLEKIATTVMQGESMILDAINRFPLEDGGSDYNSDDEAAQLLPVPQVCEELKVEVKEDLIEIGNIKRGFALDLVRERVAIKKRMREVWGEAGSRSSLSHATIGTSVEDDAEDNEFFTDSQLNQEAASTSPDSTVPLPHLDPAKAVHGVKERLAKLRERRSVALEEEGLKALRSLSITNSVLEKPFSFPTIDPVK